MYRTSKSAAMFMIVSMLMLCGIFVLVPRTLKATEQPTDHDRVEPRNISADMSEKVIQPEGTAATSVTMHYPDLIWNQNAGNPLWSLRLKTLVATREAPLFSPSRRPSPISGPLMAEPSAAPTIAEPVPLTVSLVGAISGKAENIAILVDRTSKDIIRLKTGESYFGWTLTAVKAREATLQRDNEKIILEFPGPPAK